MCIKSIEQLFNTWAFLYVSVIVRVCLCICKRSSYYTLGSKLRLRIACKQRLSWLWKCLPGKFRGFIADYGVPLMVLIWTALSYSSSKNVPPGIPRRLFSPNPWSHSASRNWTVIKARHLYLKCFMLYLCHWDHMSRVWIASWGFTVDLLSFFRKWVRFR
jgi:hypothetical protein